MDYIKQYKKFLYSHNVTDAVRVTIGMALPSIIMGYFNMLPVGLLASLGAMMVSTADIPGPMHRRFNAMAAALVLGFFVASLVGLCNTQPVILGIVIAALCFFLSLLGIYGNRVNAIGFAGLLIMVLSLDRYQSGWDIFISSLILSAGGLWYMILSLALFRMRPYLIIQQALGESIIATGDYLKTRSYFYDEDVDYDKTYKNLMEQQQSLHEKQELLREMIFKSRSIIKQSTNTGRALLIIFLESIDLFEKAAGTVYNYQAMHKRFDGTDILPRFQHMVLQMVNELYDIGLAVQTGRRSKASGSLNNELKTLKEHFENFIDIHRSPENIEPLISMRKIMHSIEDMVVRIYTLHCYTSYDHKKLKDVELNNNYDPFVASSDIGLDLIKENLSFKSNTFRHALRVSLATTAGYVVSLLLHLGHSYWVLLTILVILKPSFSLTKQRNYHRLIGTIIGALVGIGLLFLITSQSGRLAAIVVLMLATFSFIRTNYFLGVVFMTPYVLIFFYLLDPKNFASVLENRVIDTVIGSVIAFISTYILVPSWEKAQIKNYMEEALERTKEYFKAVAGSFITGKYNDMDYRLARKEAFVAQANLSSGFNRMMNEPKNKQENIEKLHQFTVIIYTLNSHIVSLGGFAQQYAAKYHSQDFKAITDNTVSELAESKEALLINNSNIKEPYTDATLTLEMENLVNKRRTELQQGLMDTDTKTILIEYKPIVDQFLFISRIAGDIKRLTDKFFKYRKQ